MPGVLNKNAGISWGSGSAVRLILEGPPMAEEDCVRLSAPGWVKKGWQSPSSGSGALQYPPIALKSYTYESQLTGSVFCFVLFNNYQRQALLDHVSHWASWANSSSAGQDSMKIPPQICVLVTHDVLVNIEGTELPGLLQCVFDSLAFSLLKLRGIFQEDWSVPLLNKIQVLRISKWSCYLAGNPDSTTKQQESKKAMKSHMGSKEVLAQRFVYMI